MIHLNKHRLPSGQCSKLQPGDYDDNFYIIEILSGQQISFTFNDIQTYYLPDDVVMEVNSLQGKDSDVVHQENQCYFLFIVYYVLVVLLNKYLPNSQAFRGLEPLHVINHHFH